MLDVQTLLAFSAASAALVATPGPAVGVIMEVRLADCWRNGHEEHLRPGEGDFDFGDMFRRLEAKGFRGHYMNAFGSLEDMQAARLWMVERARQAGVAV